MIVAVILKCTIALSESHSWYDIGKDFILPVTLGLLAALAAYYIFVREVKIEKEKDEANHIQEIVDKLTYFTALLSNGLKTATTQNKDIQAFSAAIDKDAVTFPLLTYMPHKDLYRLVEELNLESYLLAFSEYYPEDRKTSIKKFKNIMVNVDFLFHLFNAIFEQVKKGQQYDFERKTKYSDLFYKAYNLTGAIQIHLAAYPEWQKSFLDLLEAFSKNHPGNNYDIGFYNEYYFEPFNAFFIEYMDSGLPENPSIMEAAIATRDGKQAFAHIQVENKQLASDFDEEFKKIEKSISELEELTTDLLRDF